MTHPTVLRTPSRAESSWCIKVDPCISDFSHVSAHVGAFRGPLGKLGVMVRLHFDTLRVLGSVEVIDEPG